MERRMRLSAVGRWASRLEIKVMGRPGGREGYVEEEIWQ